VLVLLVLIGEGFVERPQFSDRMVAAALQAKVGPMNPVACDGTGADDWRCTVTELTPLVNGSCPQLASSLPNRVAHVNGLRLPMMCETGKVTFNVTRDVAGYLDAIDPSRKTEQQSIIDDLLKVTPSQESFWGNVVRAIKGAPR
jgi:hypothetical protein